MGIGVGTGRGGARPGAGRPKKVRPATFLPDPQVLTVLTGIRRLLETQNASLLSLQQQRRDQGERSEMVLRRLVEIERMLRGRQQDVGRFPRHVTRYGN